MPARKDQTWEEWGLDLLVSRWKWLVVAAWLGFAAFRRFHPQVVVTAKQATIPAAAVPR